MRGGSKSREETPKKSCETATPSRFHAGFIARYVAVHNSDASGVEPFALEPYQEPARLLLGRGVSPEAPLTFDGSDERRVGRTGVVWRLCSAAFADHVYLNLDLIGAERSEKVVFVELRDLALIEEGKRRSQKIPKPSEL